MSVIAQENAKVQPANFIVTNAVLHCDVYIWTAVLSLHNLKYVDQV